MLNISEDLLYTLKELRESRNKTQGELAALLGIKQNIYSDIESGKRKPSIHTLHLLSLFYQTSMDFMYHAFCRQKISYHMPDFSLTYGMNAAIQTDKDFIEAFRKFKAPSEEAFVNIEPLEPSDG